MEPVFISLNTVKWFKEFLCYRNSSICYYSFVCSTLLNGSKYSEWLDISNLPIKETLRDTTTPGQSRFGSNSNEEVLYIPKCSRRRASPSDGLLRTLMGGRDLTLLPRCSWRIEQSQSTWLRKEETTATIKRERIND